MKILATLITVVVLTIGAFAQNGAIQGQCSVGDVFPVVSGLQSSSPFLGSYPSCTVTVYLTGTITKATIFSTSGGGALGNPFTANIDGSWLLYAALGVGYDVVLSGGTPYAMPAPVTVYTDIFSEGNGAASPNLSLQGNNGGALAGVPNTTVNFSTGAMALAGNITATAGQNALSAGVLNSVIHLDGIKYATFAAAVAACPAPGTIIVDTPGTWAVSTNLSIPSTCGVTIQKGAILSPSGGVTLTFSNQPIAGIYQIFSGTGTVTGLTKVLPEWFGSTHIGATVQSSFSTNGGTLVLQPNTAYQNTLGACWTQANVWFQGQGQPFANSGYTALINGTIIQGGMVFAGTSGAHFSNLGFDNGSAYNGGASTADAFAVTGVTGCAGSSPLDPLPTGVIVENVTAMESSGAVAFHGIRMEHLYAPAVNNVTIYFGTHGLTIKSPGAIVNGVTSYGQGTDGMIIKGDPYTNVNNVVVSNFLAQTLSSANVLGAGMFLQCGGANPLVNISISGVNVINAPIGMEMLSDSFCSAGAGSQDNISVSGFSYKIDSAGVSYGLTYGFGFFSQTVGSTATNVHLNDWTIVNAAGNTLSSFEAFSLSMPMNGCTFENFHVTGVVGGGSQIDGGPLFVKNYTELTTYASRPFVMLANASVYINGYTGTNMLSTIGTASGATINYDSASGNGLGFVTSTGIFGSVQTVTVASNATPVALTNSGALTGLLRLRDNTSGGGALFLIDPNGGAQLIGTSQITGLASAAGITYSSSLWHVTLSSGTTPRVLTWTIYD